MRISHLLRMHAGLLDDAGILAAFRVDERAELIDRHRLDVGAGIHELLSGIVVLEDSRPKPEAPPWPERRQALLRATSATALATSLTLPRRLFWPAIFRVRSLSAERFGLVPSSGQ